MTIDLVKLAARTLDVISIGTAAPDLSFFVLIKLNRIKQFIMIQTIY